MYKPKIGFLPIYFELYDKYNPENGKQVEDFCQTIKNEFEQRGICVRMSSICRVKAEFENAIQFFEDGDVDAIVTLHLAYSPSLESVGALSKTKLPVIILDSTPAYDFSWRQHPSEISFNHGIHGVQDMCNLLKRNNKTFFIEAGHWEKSDVVDRVVKWVIAAKVAKQFKKARVGIIGEPFKGMGDFYIPNDELLADFGIDIIPFSNEDMTQLISEIGKDEIDNETEQDFALFDVAEVDKIQYKQDVHAGLVVRRWIEKQRLTAFTMNFLNFCKSSGWSAIPFAEACKSMARGIGYAGEGDTLTAALTGALMSCYNEVSFAEMFCPDWENDSIFLSHMGEINIDLSDTVPKLKTKPFAYTDIGAVTTVCGRFKPGKALLVNLAPGQKGAYSLIILKGEMLAVSGSDQFINNNRGWFKPCVPIDKMLEHYSMAGGTHHLTLVYGTDAKGLECFGKIMGWDICII